MAVNLNPSILRWADPAARVDGSPFGASDLRAYELGSSPDGNPLAVAALLALPTAYGVGQSPIPSVVQDNRGVIQWLHLRTVDNQGLTSVWTNGLEVLFSSSPLAPSAFSVT